MAFRFRKFKVYQDAKTLHIEVVKLSARFPKTYWYLADQIRRSSLSIVLNIAEGSSKQSDKDFNRYIAISLGSVDETIAALEVAHDIRIITEEQFQLFEKNYELISRQLGGLSKSLRS
ncbi:MAG: four helix bundle protein [Candidatus Levyibacteriota bacterium]